MEIPFEEFIEKHGLNPDLLRLLHYKTTYNNPYEKRITWQIDYHQVIKEEYEKVNDINNAIIRNENRLKEGLLDKIIPIERNIYPNILEGILFSVYPDYVKMFPDQKLSLLNTFTHSIKLRINSHKELINYRNKYEQFEKNKFIITNDLQIIIFLWMIHKIADINIKTTINDKVYLIKNGMFNAWIDTKIMDTSFEVISPLSKNVFTEGKLFIIPTKKNKLGEIVEFCNDFGIDTKKKTKEELLNLI